MRILDLSADLGESYGAWTMGDDEALLDIVTSANIACGFHAGDPLVMERTVQSCLDNGVAVGAQPGFPDLRGFGRRVMEFSADEVRTDVLYQLGALHAFAVARGTQPAHTSFHGRLGNLVVVDPHYAHAVADAVESFDPDLPMMTQEGVLAQHARERGLNVAVIGLADRAYNDDGILVSRNQPNAMITDPDEVIERCVRMAVDGVVTSSRGREIAVDCDSILLHGDNPNAVQLAGGVRSALLGAGVQLAPVAAVLAARRDRGVAP